MSPWVEGVDGSGIGEKIRIVNDDKQIFPGLSYYGFIISNGFVDFKKPYLYAFNNRVKKIRVNCGFPEEYIDFLIEDTPQLQYFFVSSKLLRVNNRMLEFEILEVYNGSRWNDTCINFIIPLTLFFDEFEWL